MLGPTGADLVLWIHVLAACVWIGGQATIAFLLPLLRANRELAAAAGRRYQWLAWPAFGVLVVTGLVNMHNAGISITHLNASPAARTLSFKLIFVLLSGLAAAVHALYVAPRAARLPSARALSASLGMLSLTAALVAALYGVVIAQS